MKLFGFYLISDLILFVSNFKIQELSVLVESSLTNFGVKNKVPQFFFKFVAGVLVLVSSYEVANILFFESLNISEAILDYGAQAFTLHSPRACLPIHLIIAHLLTDLVKMETFCIHLDTCS